ncbi:hypothetical protein C0J52_18950 [Blattella germanica]|nr:hypothetical protein C0J52_18950 [Blattella germanica]
MSNNISDNTQIMEIRGPADIFPLLLRRLIVSETSCECSAKFSYPSSLPGVITYGSDSAKGGGMCWRVMRRKLKYSNPKEIGRCCCCRRNWSGHALKETLQYPSSNEFGILRQHSCSADLSTPFTERLNCLNLPLKDDISFHFFLPLASLDHCFPAPAMNMSAHLRLGRPRPLFPVSWIRKRDLHILTAGILTYTSDARFQVIRPDKSDNWTLQIKFPQERDSGIYECQVNTEPKMSLAFRLNVIDVFMSRSFLLGYRGPSASKDPPEFFSTNSLNDDILPANPEIPNRQYIALVNSLGRSQSSERWLPFDGASGISRPELQRNKFPFQAARDIVVNSMPSF